MSSILTEKSNLINMKGSVAKHFFHHQNTCLFLKLLFSIIIIDKNYQRYLHFYTGPFFSESSSAWAPKSLP